MFRSRLIRRRIIFNSGEHLDADMLAAFDERTLGARQRAAVFAHLAECETCREWLATYSELGDFEWNTARPSKVRGFHLIPADFFQLRIAAAIAFLLFLFAAVLPRPVISPTAPPTSNTSQKFSIASQSLTTDEPRPPVVKPIASRASIGPKERRLDSRIAFRQPHPVLWRTAWFRPFDDLPPRVSGPLGQAKLAGNLNFAANFSIETAMLPSLNQIAVHTDLGERWITLDRFSSATWARF